MNAIRAAAIPVGYALEYYGKQTGRIAVQWLGHYMTCNGKKMYLPEDRVRECLKDEVLPFNHGKRYWYTMEDTYNGKESYRLYNVVGKCRMWHSFGSGLHILDRYVFYPICTYDDSHGPNCDCPDNERSWKDITFTRSIPMPKNIARHGRIEIRGWLTIAFDKWLRDSHMTISIRVKDRLFSYVGKPFYTVCHLAP